MIGTIIRGYRVVTELGSGGMGTVYFAEHPSIGRRAAIKVLNPDIARDAAMVSRFFNEARAVNAIRHPNIVDITDFGELENTYFIVMEFLEGETLGSRLERAHILEEAAVRNILATVASAVGAVHDKGIIHRDLKPENTFLTNHPDYRDYVKVLDFGLAKMPTASEQGKTQPGTVMGTPAYMSPEQCRADPAVDARTDIYALGAMAFEMLSGRTVFLGEWVEQLHAQINDQPPALSDLSPLVSPELSRLVMACLEKRPEDRPSSMHEIRELLRPGAQAPAGPTESLRPSTKPVTLVERSPEVRQKHELQEQTERVQSERVSEKLSQIVLKRLKANTLSLPAPPAAAMQCLRMLNDPNCKFGELAKVLEQDPVLASKLLRLVNSALYGSLVKTTSVEMSISRLGTKNLKVIIQEMATERLFTSRNPRILGTVRGIWTHCLAVGQIARAIATALAPSVDPDLAYLAGLIHDIGKPVVAILLLEAERNLADDDRQWMTETLWLKTVNASHRQVGEMLAKSWRFDPEIVASIQLQTDYDTRQGAKSCANIVRLANAMAKCEGLYVGPVDIDEATQTLIRGRQLLGIDDRLQALVTKDLAQRVGAATDHLA